MPLRRKLILVLVFGILLPVISLDAFVAMIFYTKEIKNEAAQRKETMVSISYNFEKTFDNLLLFSNYIYADEFIGEFLHHEYQDEVEYYKEYTNFIETSPIKLVASIIGLSGLKRIHIYTDNQTVVSGSYIQLIPSVVNTQWYQYFINSSKEQEIYCNREDKEICILKELDYDKNDTDKDHSYRCILKMDIDDTLINSMIAENDFGEDVYICMQDQILFTNTGRENMLTSYSKLATNFKQDKISYCTLLENSGWKVYVVSRDFSWYRLWRTRL